jgi:hypothetical protein
VMVLHAYRKEHWDAIQQEKQASVQRKFLQTKKQAVEAEANHIETEASNQTSEDGDSDIVELPPSRPHPVLTSKSLLYPADPEQDDPNSGHIRLKVRGKDSNGKRWESSFVFKKSHTFQRVIKEFLKTAGNGTIDVSRCTAEFDADPMDQAATLEDAELEDDDLVDIKWN